MADGIFHRLARRDGVPARSAQIDKQLRGRKQGGESMGDTKRRSVLVRAVAGATYESHYHDIGQSCVAPASSM